MSVTGTVFDWGCWCGRPVICFWRCNSMCKATIVQVVFANPDLEVVGMWQFLGWQRVFGTKKLLTTRARSESFVQLIILPVFKLWIARKIVVWLFSEFQSIDREQVLSNLFFWIQKHLVQKIPLERAFLLRYPSIAWRSWARGRLTGVMRRNAGAAKTLWVDSWPAKQRSWVAF